MGVDFSAYLDLSAPPPKPKVKKAKEQKLKFDFCIGVEGENSALTQVIVKETYFNPNDYIITPEDLEIVALYGGPLY